MANIDIYWHGVGRRFMSVYGLHGVSLFAFTRIEERERRVSDRKCSVRREGAFGLSPACLSCLRFFVGCLSCGFWVGGLGWEWDGSMDSAVIGGFLRQLS